MTPTTHPRQPRSIPTSPLILRPGRYPVGLRMQLALLALAVMVTMYHAQHALAQDVLAGESTDGHASIMWEYDLDHGTGRLILANIDVVFEHRDEYLYFGGVIPSGSRNVQFDRAVVKIDSCSPCTSGMACPPLNVFTSLQPGQVTEIGFDLPAASWKAALGPAPLDYGQGFLWSAAVCFTVPLGALSEFVSVRPIREIAPVADLDNDGDIDLRDYAAFQNRFTGPQ